MPPSLARAKGQLTNKARPRYDYTFHSLAPTMADLQDHPAPDTLQNANEGGAAQEKSSRSKAQNEGEKLVIRRLPPGMTEQELVTILGPDWEVNRGKVDWSSYVPGKVSTEYAFFVLTNNFPLSLHCTRACLLTVSLKPFKAISPK